MEKSLQEHISQINFQNLTILEVSELLDNKYGYIDIQNALVALKSEGQIKKNDFGRCGIHPESNPCGDADEY